MAFVCVCIVFKCNCTRCQGTSLQYAGTAFDGCINFAWPQVGVSLVLGFFMLWDLPMINRGVGSLKQSRLAPVYEEVAPVVSVFGKLFGKALEAQVGDKKQCKGVHLLLSTWFPASMVMICGFCVYVDHQQVSLIPVQVWPGVCIQCVLRCCKAATCISAFQACLRCTWSGSTQLYCVVSEVAVKLCRYSLTAGMSTVSQRDRFAVAY